MDVHLAQKCTCGGRLRRRQLDVESAGGRYTRLAATQMFWSNGLGETRDVHLAVEGGLRALEGKASAEKFDVIKAHVGVGARPLMSTTSAGSCSDISGFGAGI